MSGRLTLPEDTLLFGGSGKYSSVSRVTVTLCPATLRTAQILGGSKVHALPIGPQGPRHHGGHRAGPSQGRGPQPEGRTFNPRTGAKRGSNSSTSKATEFLQPRRCLLWHLGWHLVAGCTYLACYPVTWCGQWGHAHRGPKASGYVHLGCTPPRPTPGRSPFILSPLPRGRQEPTCNKALLSSPAHPGGTLQPSG